MFWRGSNNKAIGILRVSSARQKDNTSHEVQRHEVKEYCDSHNFELSKVFEIVESAKNSEDRTKYHAAIKWALDNKIQHVLFYMFDREARNLTDNEDNEKLVRQGLIALHYVRERKVLDKFSPDSDFLMRDFHAIQNKQYSRNLSAKVGDALRRKAEDGWYPANIPPLGYVPVPTLNDEGKERKRGKIVGLDPNIKKRQQVLREFELRAEGLSYEEIRKKVIAEGFIGKDKVYNYHATVIETRIKNPFYRGRFRWDGKEYQGKHELFIPRALAESVDRTLYSRNFKTKPLTQDNALAGGWLTCADPKCGCSIVFEKKKKIYRNGTEQEFRYYHCTNGKDVHESLKGMNIQEYKLWDQFEGALDCISITESFAAEISEALNEAQRKTQKATIREMDGFKEGIEATHKEEDELYQDFKKRIVTEESYLRMVKQVRNQRLRFTDHLKHAQLAISDAGMETAKSILELSTSAKSLWKSRTPLERKELLNDLLSNPVLDGVTLRYEIKKPFRILSEMAESEKWRARKGSNL